MKLLFSLLFALLVLSCGEKEAPVINVDKKSLSENQIDSILLNNNYAYAKPLAIDSTDQLLVPLVLNKVGQSKRSFSKYDSNTSNRETWNVIFYNIKTETTSLLSEDKMKIARIHTKPNSKLKNSPFVFNSIFYEIRKKDYNLDKVININDPLYLFSSDLDGSDLERISPENENLIYFKYLGSSTSLLLETKRDTNEDKLFNDNDESVIYKASYANNKWNLNEAVSQSLKDKVDNLYFDQWLNQQ